MKVLVELHTTGPEGKVKADKLRTAVHAAFPTIYVGPDTHPSVQRKYSPDRFTVYKIDGQQPTTYVVAHQQVSNLRLHPITEGLEYTIGGRKEIQTIFHVQTGTMTPYELQPLDPYGPAITVRTADSSNSGIISFPYTCGVLPHGEQPKPGTPLLPKKLVILVGFDGKTSPTSLAYRGILGLTPVKTK